MIEARADFLIIGSTPLARLLAGLLAASHGKSVILAADSHAAFRLSRSLDLSVGLLTRPESWALLAHTMPETIRLITRIGGRRTWSRRNPVFQADSDAAQEALSHMRHMAQAYGHAAELVTTGLARGSVVLRDAVLLHRPALEPVLDAWLGQSGVRLKRPEETLTLRRDGSAILGIAPEQVEIGQVVLADDAAILAHLPAEQWPALLTRQGACTVAGACSTPMAASILIQVDNGMTLVQQAHRGLTALAYGRAEQLEPRLRALVGAQVAFRPAGQASYDIVGTTDSAPAVGRIDGDGMDLLAGLGPTGAFLAPAIARWMAGSASSEEDNWLRARLVTRAPLGSVVADIGVMR